MSHHRNIHHIKNTSQQTKHLLRIPKYYLVQLAYLVLQLRIEML